MPARGPVSHPFQSQFELCVRSRGTLLVVVTHEEERAVRLIRESCGRLGAACRSWDTAGGMKLLTGERPDPQPLKDPLAALEFAEAAEEPTVFIFRDLHELWTHPEVKRKLRSVAQALRTRPASLVVTGPSALLPEELHDEAVVLRLPLPSLAELQGLLDQLTRNIPERVRLTPLGRQKIVQAARGMSENQARHAFARALAVDGYLDEQDIQSITAEKKELVRRGSTLEFFSPAETIEDVGGLEVLKDWLRLRELGFGQEARDYGLPEPRGILLLGIPGTGKSLTAKMIANLWRLPLLRLDAGALFGSLVGESEDRTRRALAVAEAIAPCVLWVDEIEKSFTLGHGDSGTSQRVFATLLTWMQEKTAPCFMVATANNVQGLPAELMRRGRFDEIFFLDLPTPEERRQIFEVHLRRRRRLPAGYDLARLVAQSAGYVGAEIEQAIVDALFVAFSQGMREVTTDDIAAALRRQIPLSTSQRETVDTLREWLQSGRAQSASLPPPGEPSPGSPANPGGLDPLAGP